MSGELTYEMIERAYREVEEGLRREPSYFYVNTVQYNYLWFVWTFPTLYAASLYRTPWERFRERCEKKMREIETYSSHKALFSRIQQEQEPDY